MPQPLETPQNSSPLLLRPTSPPISPRPSSGDFSPHPARRMMTHTSSNPDLTEPPGSTFVRNQQSRRSLRVCKYISIFCLSVPCFLGVRFAICSSTSGQETITSYWLGG